MKQEQKNKEDRIEWVKNRLFDMNHMIENRLVGDAIKTDFTVEAAKLLKELKKSGIDYETPSAFLTLAAIKAGIPPAKRTGEAGVEVEPTVVEPARKGVDMADPRVTGSAGTIAPRSPFTKK